ncbi:hypothetical protein D3C72_2290250 [compost metagenome]
MERKGCGRAYEAVEHDRYAQQAGGQDRPRDGGDLAPAQNAQGIESVSDRTALQFDGLTNHLDLPRPSPSLFLEPG